MTNIAGKEIGTPDLAIMGAGAVALIDSFIPWYRVEVFGTSFSANAWDFGLAWLAVLLMIAVAGLVAARIFADFRLPTTLPVGPNLILLAASALALLFVVIRWLKDNDYTFIGLYIGIIAAIVQVVFLALAFKASGEKLPEFNKPSTPPPSA